MGPESPVERRNTIEALVRMAAIPRGCPTTRQAPGPRGRSFTAHSEDILEMWGIRPVRRQGNRRFPTSNALPEASELGREAFALGSRWTPEPTTSSAAVSSTSNQCGAAREVSVREDGATVCARLGSPGQCVRGRPQADLRGAQGAWLPRCSLYAGRVPLVLGPYFVYVPPSC